MKLDPVSGQGLSKVTQLRLPNLDHDATYMWHMLSKLLNRPWFSRMWVVQEVGMAKSALAMIGDVKIDFADLLIFTNRVRRENFLLDRFGLNTISAITFNIFPQRNKKLNIEFGSSAVSGWDFLDIPELSRAQLASDSRDYVYALLGHPSALLGGIPIVEPNYNKSESDLFSEIAIKLLEDTKSLRILSAVRHSRETDLERPLTSWIPTWSRVKSINSLGVHQRENNVFDAAADTSGSWKVAAPGRTLYVNGFVFDVIDECTKLMEYAGVSKDVYNADQLPIQAAMCFKTRMTRPAGEKLSEIAQTLTVGNCSGNPLYKETLLQHLANFAAFRLHLIKQTPPQEDSNNLAPEGLVALHLAAEGGDMKTFLADGDSQWASRKLFSTQQGLLGMASSALCKGDRCCILFGATVPFILRQVGSRYRLVGEAYIHGAMQGEAMVDFIVGEICQEQIFEIF